jgi:hypothetical protein
MELALDPTDDKELPRGCFDRDEPVRMHCTAIFAGLFEGAWRQLLDDTAQEVLAKLNFSRGLEADVQERRTTENAEE